MCMNYNTMLGCCLYTCTNVNIVTVFKVNELWEVVSSIPTAKWDIIYNTTVCVHAHTVSMSDQGVLRKGSLHRATQVETAS